MIDNGDDVIHAEILFEHQIIEDTSHKDIKKHLLYIKHLIELNTPIKKIKKYINNQHITENTKYILQKMINEQHSNILEEDEEVDLGKILFGAWAIKEILEKREFSAKARLTNFMRKAKDLHKESKSTADIVEREVKNYMSEMESFYRDNTKYAREYAYDKVDKKLSTQVRGWISVAVLDNRTSAVCAGLHNTLYLKKDYATRFDIPNPPPRHPNCRSILLTVWEGTRITDYKGQKLETWLKQNPKQAEGMLGKKKYKIFMSGKAKINKYIDLKGHRFYRNDEIIKRLGIKSENRLRKINEK